MMLPVSESTGMTLAAEYIPSPLQLMLVTSEIGFPIPPVSRPSGLSGPEC